MDTKKSFLKQNTITGKTIVIGVLTLLMLIPISMVKTLITERQGNKDAEQTEMGWLWGGRQTVTGPVMAVRYIPADAPKEVRTAYFLPDEYAVGGNVKPEERTRGIQKILNYQAEMNISGQFGFPDVEALGINPSQVLWNESYLMLGIPNLQGIKNKIDFKVNGQSLEIEPSVPHNDIISSGLTIRMALNPEQKEVAKYNFDLVLNGTEGLYFLPIGKQTNIHLTSTWKSVEYIGNFVPAEKADVSAGIDARWDIYDYNRNFTQMWKGKNEGLEQSKLGIDLELPVNHYEKTLRAVKYAIMFIVLTFLVFFLVELLGKKRIHAVQYLLVSLALILFYTLLLAFSEHIGFDWSYLISALAIVLLITAYSHSIFKQKKQTIFMGIFLTVLYVYLYVVLQQENMALLFGAIGLFIALAAVMYALRKVDWYKEDEKGDAAKESGMAEIKTDDAPPAYKTENDNVI
ncbi:inner membrane protein [Dysgonomonas sp. PFB1-18]|uniref:cell envelope integrity protein CreD n=1 Tax=unclassified Dysgonomonas TaxID=2630389 RepID=UPI002474D5DF|nr:MULTISPECIES: cell envelope integrity protein CreD [unclassified Dysgonomonas]MDH6307750.1 inner membrane protein [Dysgonomonas sp. PF1-14]MDH6337668.1 inner membrane protein [Dysgonomonas sp. PF1-16]MDH6378892.1 inner membrane protein [Dysgonomonas sp. PFB1-18]MDH6396527.1 inner membrane protein [Dysgonomonas sp. PF1-23]